MGGDAVTKETAIQYKEHLKKKYKPASVNSMLAAVNRFFREMGWFGCIVKALKIQQGGVSFQRTGTEQGRIFPSAGSGKGKQEHQAVSIDADPLCHRHPGQ